MNKMLQAASFTPPWIIGHRGFKKKYPENTLAGFRAAMDTGVPMIELDVTLSRDRKLVVIHDDTLDRTTNGHGPVGDQTLEQLKRLDAGSWFHSDFKGERLPQLVEVLKMVKGRGMINIEIKSNAYESHHPPDAIEKQVVDLVMQENAADKILISSFNAEILQQISEIAGRPELALISSEPADEHTLEFCRNIHAFSWHPDHRVATEDQVKRMHAAGIRVFPYTVNTFEDYAAMRAMGVDGIITDDPEAAKAWQAAGTDRR